MEALWVATAFALGLTANRLGFPPLVGYLGAGFLLHGLGFRETAFLSQAAEIGILLLLFSVGLRLRLKDLLDPRVLGAGGAGRAVAFALKGAGLEVWVWNRTPERALALARELGLEAVPLERARAARLLVNATRVGLEDPTATPLPAELFPEEGAAVDLVYRPLWTRFLREAKEKGLRVQTGLPMLAWQGALAFRIWTGLLPDPLGMERAALRALGG
jgi:shikimate 5-dehydrogenase